MQTHALELGRMSCKQARDHYLLLLRQAGLSANRAQQYLPSCEVLSRVSFDMTSCPPAWQHCLGYPGGFNPDHFKGCIGDAEHDDCPGLIERYRRGLMAADRFGQLPRGYRDPDCGLVAAALTAPEPGVAAKEPAGPGSAPAWQPPPQWAKCLKYDPANVTEHMKICLGPDYTRLTSCEAVQRIYERDLRAAYNGLPQGYVTITCPQAAIIEKLAFSQIEAEREAAEQARIARARADEARRAGALVRGGASRVINAGRAVLR
jgi:hypothetical protein